MRAVLAILLLFGVYLVALLGVALAGGFIVLSVLSMRDYLQGETTSFSPQIVLGLVGAIASFVAMIAALFTVNQAATDTKAVRVDEEEAPELWAFVKEVAAEAGIRPPDELWLNGEVNAAVSEDSRLLGLLPGRRRLYLGLPLLAELSANELRALLGHEFGHYLGWHTRVGMVVHRGYLALDRIRENMAKAHFVWGPSGMILHGLNGYIRLYARVSYAVRRSQEFEADTVAARIAGPKAAMQALRSLAAIDATWQLFRQHYLLRTAAAGYAPEDPLAMFAAMLSDNQRREELDRLKAQDPEPQKYDRYASHPSMADRLDRLAGMTADVPARLREPKPSDWRYPTHRLIDHLLPEHEVEPLPAAQWLDKTSALAAPTAAARVLLDATGPKSTLDTVLDALEAGEAARLARRFDAEDPHRAMARLCEALHGLVGYYLVEAGSAHWRLSWTGPSDLVVSELRADGVHVLPFAQLNALVFAAVDDRHGVGRLRLHLASLRVDPRRPFAAEAERTVTVAVDQEPARRERARRKRTAVYGGIMLVAALGVLVLIETAPTPPPRSFNPIVPTFDFPTATTFPFFPSGEELPSFPPALPSFDVTMTGPIAIRPGDTLDALARCHLTTVAELQRLNGLGDSTTLQAGQTLLVPNAFLACRKGNS